MNEPLTRHNENERRFVPANIPVGSIFRRTGMFVGTSIFKGGFIMSTLFIGGIILVALMPLLKGTRRNAVDSYTKTSWDEARKIDQRIQQSKDKALGIFPWIRW
jgi:hypothetical protein